MSAQDDYTWTFRERAMMDETADRVVAKMRAAYPNLGGSNISWRDFGYSIAKGIAAAVVGFIMLAALWATIKYMEAGAPAVPGISH